MNLPDDEPKVVGLVVGLDEGIAQGPARRRTASASGSTAR